MEEAQKGRDRARLHSARMHSATAKWQSACNTQNACMRGDMGEQESSPMSPSSFAALLLCSSAPLLLYCSAAAAAASAPWLPPAAREVQQEVRSCSSATT